MRLVPNEGIVYVVTRITARLGGKGSCSGSYYCLHRTRGKKSDTCTRIRELARVVEYDYNHVLSIYLNINVFGLYLFVMYTWIIFVYIFLEWSISEP